MMTYYCRSYNGWLACWIMEKLHINWGTMMLLSFATVALLSGVGIAIAHLYMRHER